MRQDIDGKEASGDQAPGLLLSVDKTRPVRATQIVKASVSAGTRASPQSFGYSGHVSGGQPSRRRCFCPKAVTRRGRSGLRITAPLHQDRPRRGLERRDCSWAVATVARRLLDRRLRASTITSCIGTAPTEGRREARSSAVAWPWPSGHLVSAGARAAGNRRGRCANHSDTHCSSDGGRTASVMAPVLGPVSHSRHPICVISKCYPADQLMRRSSDRLRNSLRLFRLCRSGFVRCSHSGGSSSAVVCTSFLIEHPTPSRCVGRTAMTTHATAMPAAAASAGERTGNLDRAGGDALGLLRTISAKESTRRFRNSWPSGSQARRTSANDE